MKLSEVWELYLQDKTLMGFSPITLSNYCIQINMLIKYLDDKDINEITMFDLKQYLIEKGSHLQKSSLGQRIRAIRSVFKTT